MSLILEPPSPTPAAIHSEAPAIQESRFIVGQDGQGHWVAVETHGLAGGLFRSRKDAIHYAAGETRNRPDAVVLVGLVEPVLVERRDLGAGARSDALDWLMR